MALYTPDVLKQDTNVIRTNVSNMIINSSIKADDER